MNNNWRIKSCNQVRCFWRIKSCNPVRCFFFPTGHGFDLLPETNYASTTSCVCMPSAFIESADAWGEDITGLNHQKIIKPTWCKLHAGSPNPLLSTCRRAPAPAFGLCSWQLAIDSKPRRRFWTSWLLARCISPYGLLENLEVESGHLLTSKFVSFIGARSPSPRATFVYGISPLSP